MAKKSAFTFNEMVEFARSGKPVRHKGKNDALWKSEDGIVLYRLFGIIIAVLDLKRHTIRVMDNGYQTVTTKDRLNGIMSHFGHGIYQKNYNWYQYGKGKTFAIPWGGHMTFSFR